MTLYLTALSAVVPSLLLLWYFHSRDIYPEPPRVIWTTFGLGFLAIIPTLIVAIPTFSVLESTFDEPLLLAISKALFTAAVPEELFKLLVLIGYCSRHHEFDEPMDGLVYGAAASLGFATLENVLYSINGGLTLATTRSLTAVPSHAFLGAIMGFYVGQAHFVPHRKNALYICAFAVPTVLHTLYNVPLLLLISANETQVDVTPVYYILPSLLVLFIEAFFAQRLLELLREEQLEEQLLSKPVPETEYEFQHPSPQAWFITIIGALSTTVGCLLAIGLALTLLDGDHHIDSTAFLWRGAITGLVPLILGVFIFRHGLNKLDQSSKVQPLNPAGSAPDPV